VEIVTTPTRNAAVQALRDGQDQRSGIGDVDRGREWVL
jgi:hypothetical protein